MKLPHSQAASSAACLPSLVRTVGHPATTMQGGDLARSPFGIESYCRLCCSNHVLPREPAMQAAMKLMARLAQEKRIDFAVKRASPRSKFTTDSLYGKARGKMFGVLSCRTAEGEERVLKAFSGQYNGIWEVGGWAPPLFDVEAFHSLTRPVEQHIKDLGRAAEETDLAPGSRNRLLRKRKELSRKLMQDIHRLYCLHNFRGNRCSLFDLFADGSGIPTGTGDCCAPKLLNLAARKGLQPLGLAEFYWGRSNKSATRHQGHFYPACQDKCAPILGFLLCGLEAEP